MQDASADPMLRIVPLALVLWLATAPWASGATQSFSIHLEIRLPVLVSVLLAADLPSSAARLAAAHEADRSDGAVRVFSVAGRAPVQVSIPSGGSPPAEIVTELRRGAADGPVLVVLVQ